MIWAEARHSYARDVIPGKVIAPAQSRRPGTQVLRAQSNWKDGSRLSKNALARFLRPG